MTPRGRPRHPDVLTPAEWEVLNWVRHGVRNRAIAEKRNTSVDAVKFHVANLFGKLGIDARDGLRQWRGAPAASPVHIEQEKPMAATYPLGPIGQIALTVDSIERAVPYYRDTLGLKHLYTFGNLSFFDCHGTRLFLTAASDEEHDRNHSVIYFQVPDINHAYDSLSARGVKFEGAPHMIHRHEDGTEEWMAFFTDPDGNLLAIMAQPRA
jgi:DNA-binding CsgD family transcriptional regulator/predicted enzyme related to lactoylglutathione lyase